MPPLPLGREEAVMNLSDSSRFSRQVAGGGMILGPIVIVLAECSMLACRRTPPGSSRQLPTTRGAGTRRTR